MEYLFERLHLMPQGYVLIFSYIIMLAIFIGLQWRMLALLTVGVGMFFITGVELGDQFYGFTLLRCDLIGDC